MISVLIPVYNFNVLALVNDLNKQLILSNIDFEIICLDDGSLSLLNKENEKVNFLTNCKFITSKQNVGRSNNRNILAEASKYEYILFIDADSILPDQQFITRYLNAVEENTDIIYGGRVHPKTVESNRKLRWKYGKYREDLIATKRRIHKYKHTLFNNTLIKKKVFDQIRFEKSIIQYGHEDTVFAYKASTIKASVLHIDNPVIHGDVDFNEVFFYKMHKSLENLNSIYKTHLIDSNFITFLRIFSKLKRFKLNYLFALIHKIFYPFFKYNLISKIPSLVIFDLFRLSYFCNINLKK